MTRINVKEARGKLSDLLDRVEAGDEIVITRRGDDVARIVPAKSKQRRPFVSHKALRDSIKLKGEAFSKTIIRMRREARY